MAEDDARPAPQMKRGKVLGQPGQPLQFIEAADTSTTVATTSPAGEAEIGRAHV